MSYDHLGHIKSVLRANQNAKTPEEKSNAKSAWAGVPVNEKLYKEAKRQMKEHQAREDEHNSKPLGADFIKEHQKPEWGG
jgi:hypothetical protein